MQKKVFAGTSGLQIDRPKRDFPLAYAQLSRLGYYALHENSIEINSSFYKVPQQNTLTRWVREVGPDFLFTFKLWSEISHKKNLIFNAADLSRFMKTIHIIPEVNKGCLLVQFPPSLHVNAMSQLRELIESLKSFQWPIAIEFRHSSWYQDETYELLNLNQVAMVIQDMPASGTPIEVTSDEFVYLRFHGPSGNYKGSYSDSFLNEYAGYIKKWQEEGKAIYLYFNNTAGAALENLQSLKKCLADHYK
ncbi:DUF72 domain-containing protein [Mucilaginibacter rubeus]|uniref:DUF72 domain-containing protein n=1 Tax=Mucilaginibacter rubeus TaxID=2027860 RepID=A0A5C1I5H2_9SPHI|nr:DUF72 domain-containing protein [Mucilaginibacter rubeus]QEM12351.1 DUF72 domain-containing protein [Mucilaginibacter rubeus]